MLTQTTAELTAKKCVPCEGGVPRYELPEAEAQVANEAHLDVAGVLGHLDTSTIPLAVRCPTSTPTATVTLTTGWTHLPTTRWT